jgi:RNA polymerase sigma-70 factor (ECF subfamily)
MFFIFYTMAGKKHGGIEPNRLSPNRQVAACISDAIRLKIEMQRIRYPYSSVICDTEVALKTDVSPSKNAAIPEAPSDTDLAKTLSKIMPIVYDELRRLARLYLRREKAGHSLEATALVNEAYVRLAREKAANWHNRAHFCAIAAGSMREILVERSRALKAAKRGGSRVRVTLGDNIAADAERGIDMLALDEALVGLSKIDPQLARIVELRFFGGLTIEESADYLAISPATVKRGWNLAKAWLKREMQRDQDRES